MPVTNVKSKWSAGNLHFHGTGEIVLDTGVSLDLTAEKVMIDFKAGDASTVDPSGAAEDGWINVNVDGTKCYIPWYAAT